MITELFKPMKIGNCTIPNRLIVPAMVVNVCNDDGTLSDRFIKYHEERAKGGWGMIITEDYGVSADAKGYTNIPGLWDDAQIPKNKEFTDLIHSYGSKIWCQIYHAGKQKMPNVPGQAVSPSAIKDPLAMNMPRELTKDEIHEIIKDFGSCARADFIAMGRESLADPYFPTKVKDGEFDQINYCIGCLQGCEAGVLTDHATCLVNPRCVNEVENDFAPADVKKDVMVIGAGPAGLMAARTAAKRGHKVTVYDKDTHFGGAFRSASYPMGKGILSTVISGYRAQCEHLGVEFRMGCEVTEDLIKDIKPEAIVVATGSRPLVPNIPGIDGKNVVTAEDVLYGNVDVYPGPVVVCGGGEVGGETAEFIAQTNRDVTILEMKPQILSDMFVVNMISLINRIYKQGIKPITNATVTFIGDNSITYKDAEGKEVTIPADTIVSAFGYKAYNPLQEIAEANCSEVYTVGSAVKAGNALVAIKEGYEAGLKL